MKRIALLATLTAFVALRASDVALFAADRGSSAEAKVMLQHAIAHYKAVGRRQALADFTAKKPPFSDRDLYVVCISPEHIVVANGGFADHVGSRGDLMKDINGKGVAEAAWEVTSDTGEGMVRYRWLNPTTRTMELKVTLFARVGTDVCGVGVYSPM
ncbi:MAG: cache domain-containing protein [Candidatus Sulfotelmatobacter sp.]